MKTFTTTVLLCVLYCTFLNAQGVYEGNLGGQKDKKGCLASAGQSYSPLLKKCVQVFNVGIRLNPTFVQEGNAVFSAFVIYSSNKSKIEIHVPGHESRILHRNKGFEDYQFRYDESNQILYLRNGQVYKSDMD